MRADTGRSCCPTLSCFSSVGDFLLVSLDFAFLIELGLYAAHEYNLRECIHSFLYAFNHTKIFIDYVL